MSPLTKSTPLPAGTNIRAFGDVGVRPAPASANGSGSAGVLEETVVNEMVVFIDVVEARTKPFNRFVHLSALDAVDLNFKFVFNVALHRRLAAKGRSPVKSAFYVTSRATAHYAKLHAMLTDFSPLEVSLFTDRTEAAVWLGVPVEALTLRL